MGHYLIEAEQYLSTSPEEAWSFLSDPSNLSKITPPNMKFEILEGADLPMFAGQMIHYKVSPFKGFRMHWITEITQVSHGEYFIDEQRAGPYKMWHHQHRILPVDGGICMVDIVNYQLPFGVLGSLMHAATVSSQLRNIFKFREAALKKRFGSLDGHPDSLTFKSL